MVHLQLLERPAVHRDGILPRVIGEVGQLRRHEIALARMPAQGYARGTFRQAAAVRGRRVDIIHAVRHGIVHQFVHHLLVYLVALPAERQAHHAESQQRHLVARGGTRPDRHLPCGHFSRFAASPRLPLPGTATIHRRRSGRRTRPEQLEELTASHLLILILLFHTLYLFIY